VNLRLSAADRAKREDLARAVWLAEWRASGFKVRPNLAIDGVPVSDPFSTLPPQPDCDPVAVTTLTVSVRRLHITAHECLDDDSVAKATAAAAALQGEVETLVGIEARPTESPASDIVDITPFAKASGDQP